MQIRLHLAPRTKEELEALLAHRLEAAGATSPLGVHRKRKRETNGLPGETEVGAAGEQPAEG
jgi:hypothetical protein